MTTSPYSPFRTISIGSLFVNPQGSACLVTAKAIPQRSPFSYASIEASLAKSVAWVHTGLVCLFSGLHEVYYYVLLSFMWGYGGYVMKMLCFDMFTHVTAATTQ